jgi:hypothetical protein
MAFRVKTKTLDELKTSRRVAGTAPLSEVPLDRHVPTMQEVRHTWMQSHPDGPIPAVGNLFGDATGQMLQARLASAVSTDDYLAVADEARSYGDHAIARVAVERAEAMAVREREMRQIEALQAAMQPSELEKALRGFGG